MVPNPLSWPVGCRFASRCDYVFDRCLREDPPLLDAGAQRAACWLVEGGARESVGTTH
jgi:peptide/nickel transport system ATP-binding protein